MELTNLVKILQEASDKYYNSDTSALSDAEFDQLVDELRKIDPTHPFLAEVGARVKTSAWPKVKHKYIMGSQDKVKTKEEFLKWADGKGSLVLTDKLDGSTIVLTYEDGQLISAASRGDGFEGDELFTNVVRLQNVKECLEGFSGVLRGEVILPLSAFNKHFAPLGYKNSRNAAAGLVREKSGMGLLKHIKVVYFDVIGSSTIKTEIEKQQFVVNHGLEYVYTTKPLNAEDVWAAFEKRMIERPSLDFEIDGSVCKVNQLSEQEAFGHLNNRPRGMIAIKPESQSKETKIVDIQWQLGLSGRISPVLYLEPIEIGGVEISRCTANNIDYLKKLDAAVGDIVLIERANDIIPRLVKVTDRSQRVFYCQTCKTISQSRNGVH